jgi:hypothetical protein
VCIFRSGNRRSAALIRYGSGRLLTHPRLAGPYPTHFRHDNDGASHSAVRASAAADRIEAVVERHLETHRTAMAQASPNVRIANHVACVACSDRFDAHDLVSGRERPGGVNGLEAASSLGPSGSVCAATCRSRTNIPRRRRP